MNKIYPHYTDYFFVCEDCGSISWKEVSNKAIKITMNKKGIIIKKGEEWIDGMDTYCICEDCGSDNLTSIDNDDLKNLRKMKELANMDNKERLDWLQKHKVME